MDAPKWSPGKTMADIEREIVIYALELNGQNRTNTARELGMGIRTLRLRLARYRSFGYRIVASKRGVRPS